MCLPTTLERVHIKKCHRLVAAVTLFVCLLVGCSAGPSSDSTPAPPAVSAASPPAIPSDGITLAALGYLNGPIQQFSLPRTVRITTKVDQPNNVVAVVSSPSPAAIASYLRRALAGRRLRYHRGQSRGEHHDFCWLRLERQLHRP